MSTTCLVPAYNEASRLPYVLRQLTLVSNLSQIIVVDDGSTDLTNQLTHQFPTVTFLHHPHNLGKAAAIKTGLKQIKTPNVLLFDADIDFVDPAEVQKSLTIFESQLPIDMLVYRTIRDKWPQKLVRTDLFLCGERLLRTADLKLILQAPITGFQLEVAINHYYIHHHKQICWMPFSGLSPNKLHKLGLARGIIPELNMVSDLFHYRGITAYFMDLIRFHATQI